MKRFMTYGLLGSAVVIAPMVGYYLLLPSAPQSPQVAAIADVHILPAPPPQAHASSTIPLFTYLETVDGCGPYYKGTCVNLREGPSTSSPVVMQLRNHMVLKVASTTVVNGQTWYEIGFDGDIHYPERIKSNWYVSGKYVRVFRDPGVEESNAGINASSTKRIIVNLKTETLYAYDGDTLFLKAPISTGLDHTPTPAGTFWVYRKIPDSYMQGPVPGVSDQYYDLPGVPWDLYFTKEGAAIHGAYWHNHFGEPWSHGCVNLAPNEAKKLYYWADLGTPVIVVQ